MRIPLIRVPKRRSQHRLPAAARLSCEYLEERRVLSAEVDPAVWVLSPDVVFDAPRPSDFQASDGVQQGRGVLYFHPDRLKLSFSAPINIDSAEGVHSALHSGNWRLLKDGADVSHLIVSIATASENEVTLQLSEKLTAGNYEIVARDSIHDLQGRPIDGDGNLQLGGDAQITFVVASATSEASENIGRALETNFPVTAADASGNYVVAWIGTPPGEPGTDYDSSQTMILAQRYNSAGHALGGVMTLSDPVTGESYNNLRIAMNSSGEFVVGWSQIGSSIFSQFGLRVRRFDASGQPLGEAVEVGRSFSLDGLAINAAGEFVVGYRVSYLSPPFDPNPMQSATILQRFSAASVELGDPIRLENAANTRVALADNGRLVAVWEDWSTSARRPFVQVFGPSGAPLTEELPVSWLPGSAASPAIGMDRTGSFVVAWDQEFGGQHRVYAQRFDALGVFLGPVIEVSKSETYANLPSVAVHADGSFFITWDVLSPSLTRPSDPFFRTLRFSNLNVEPGSVRARGYDATGRSRGGEFAIGDIDSATGFAAAAAGVEGTLVVVWLDGYHFADSRFWPYDLDFAIPNHVVTDFPVYSLHTLGRSVHVQQFSVPAALALDLNGDPPGIDFWTNFTPGGSEISIVDSARLEVYGAIEQLTSAAATISGFLAGDVLHVNTQGSPIVASYQNGVLTLSGAAPVSNYEQVLRTLTFGSTASRSPGTTVSVSIVIGDGVSESEPALAKVSIHVPGRSSVAGRHVFYNNSSFDGNDPAANSGDDGTIATDKSALLPGQASTFANYTSYTRGINGIIIDLAGEHGTITRDDFIFRIGNGNDTAHWAYAPEPLSVVVRSGAGANGSDRVEIVWADGAIKNLWLQVIVLDNGNTGLAASDSFFFGNHIGDTGNEPDQVRTTTTDLMRAVNHILNDPGGQTPVAIDSPLDFNRDGRITTHDVMAAVNQILQRGDPLELITINSATAQSGAITAGLSGSMAIVLVTPEEVQGFFVQAAVLEYWDPQEEELELLLPVSATTLLMTDPDRV